MPIILNIETSTTNCSVSLSDANETICLIEENFEQFSHSKSLHVFIDQILKRSKIVPKDLSAISISEGPGSYTGLRIGVSAAKGLCFGLGIPLISIDTLFILSRKIECSKGYIISALDARRNEIYYSILKSNKCKLPKKIKGPDSLVLSKDSFEKYLNKDVVNFVGNSNKKIKKLINHKNAEFTKFMLPSANEMGIIANSKFKKKDFVDISSFQPKYLKEFGGKKINI